MHCATTIKTGMTGYVFYTITNALLLFHSCSSVLGAYPSLLSELVNTDMKAMEKNGEFDVGCHQFDLSLILGE